jgi:predicted 2-oxoglutarate/Fe(II)-dependent dioxygenase YbiX
MTLATRHNLITSEGIVELRNALSPRECVALIGRAEALGFVDAPITVGHDEFRMAPEIRSNQRVILDAPELAADLWTRLSHCFPVMLNQRRAAGLNERFRFYRYDEGQRFNWHRDGAYVRSRAERSCITLLFYLNDDFGGGTTDFVASGLRTVQPRQGNALAFVHSLLHQGAPVTDGRKYVLRTDVMYAEDPGPGA